MVRQECQSDCAYRRFGEVGDSSGSALRLALQVHESKKHNIHSYLEGFNCQLHGRAASQQIQAKLCFPAQFRPQSRLYSYDVHCHRML
jgi:hypothetical protein